MKVLAIKPHCNRQVLAARPDTQPDAPSSSDVPALDVQSVYDSHADFLWRMLGRFGVADADLADEVQEVLIVVHRRISDLSDPNKLRSWLYGICRRVASAYRKRAHRGREKLVDHSAMIERSTEPAPDDMTMRRQARERLHRVLDEMNPERRAVFVMFELEELSCAEIAEQVGAPVGTVYSRLHAARAEFRTALRKLHRAEADRPLGKEGES